MTLQKLAPRNLMILLRYFDVNGLSDSEADLIAVVDIEDDAQLARLMREWLRPNYLEWSEGGREEMLQVLKASEQWSTEDLERVFSKIQLPTGQQVKDVDRFVRAMRTELVDSRNE